MAQTKFDLNIAIETWRNELAGQPQLTPDDRRELERHLTDSMADYRGRGLTDEEAFWLARQRIGKPQQLADEYEKADPVKVWRQRIFWIALAIFVWRLFSEVVAVVSTAVVLKISPHTGPYAGSIPWDGVVQIAGFVPVLFFVLTANGRLVPQLQKLTDLIRDRRRLALIIFILLILAISVRTAAYWAASNNVAMLFGLKMWEGLAGLNEVLLGLTVIWLMPFEPKALRTVC
jgi:hypothetical protein